jgi:hypothetical protein
MFRSRFLLTATVAVVAALVAPATSQATFTITISDGTNSVTFTDGSLVQTNVVGANALAGDILPMSGSIGVSGNIGPFSTALTGATSNSTPPVLPATLGLSQLVLTNLTNSTQTYTITVIDDNFMVPTGDKVVVASLAWTNPSANVISASLATTVAGTPLTTLTYTSGSVGSVDNTSIVEGPTSGPYTVQQVLTLTLGAHGVFQGSAGASITPTPAPAGLVLLAGALPFAGLLRLRRRLTKVAPTTAA